VLLASAVILVDRLFLAGGSVSFLDRDVGFLGEGLSSVAAVLTPTSVIWFRDERLSTGSAIGASGCVDFLLGMMNWQNYANSVQLLQKSRVDGAWRSSGALLARNLDPCQKQAQCG
jgi:hypothetical protein